MTPRIELACLDMAGTTVADGGLVESAFAAALDGLGVSDPDLRAEMDAYVRETMGTSKIDVFRRLLGGEAEARRANTCFERAYDELIESSGVAPVPGAEAAIAELRAAGVKVALLTGFSAATRDRIVAALGWQQVADLLLCPSEAGRGRPAPDLVLASLLRLRVSEVAAVAVAGDTASDMESGRRAGAPFRIGVLTGSDAAERLRAGGATHLADSVADLPALLRDAGAIC